MVTSKSESSGGDPDGRVSPYSTETVINLYTTLLAVACLGAVGNLLTFVVLVKLRYRYRLCKSAASFSLIVLCISDVVFLTGAVINAANVGANFLHEGTEFWRIFMSIWSAAFLMTSWMVVILCLER